MFASRRVRTLRSNPSFAIVAIVGAMAGAPPSLAATFVVNTTADGADGACTTSAGGCTLRDAIRAANALAGADIITVPAGTFTLTIAGAGEDAAATGDLDITGPVTINGAGTTSTIIDAGRIDRVFDIYDTAGNVTIQGLTVRNGFSGFGTLAGGIWNSAVLTLNQVRVQTSEGRLGGGGILNDNDLTANDVTLSGNTTNSQGGGLYNTGVARLNRTTVSGNTSAATGAGIHNDGTLTLTNVTLSGNTAVTDGGGLNNSITATLQSVTVASNGANRGGGIFSPGDVTINNTIVANNSPGANCNVGGSLSSLGANLDSGATCAFAGAGDQSNKNPLLTPLQDNGGPTLTHAISPGSPAVDVGGSTCPGTLATDQRGTGFPRALDGDGNGSVLCDSGAYELNPASPPTTTSTITIPTTSTTSSTSTSSSTSTTRSTSTSSSTSTSTSRPTTSSSTSSSTSTSRPTTSTTSSSTSTSRPTTTSSTSSSTSTSRPTTTSSTSTSTSTSRPSTTSTTSSSTSTSRPTTTSSTSSSTSTSRPSTTSRTSTSTSTSRPSTTGTSSTSTSTSRPSTTSSTSSSSSTSTTRVSTSSSTSRSTSSSTTTSSSSTSPPSTLLVVGCVLPRTDCVPSADPLLSIKEGNPGRERLRLDLKKLVPHVTQSQFGDPATGTTRYDVCIYDDAARLAGSLIVDRAGQSCGDSSTACWEPIGAKGYRYNDRDAVADGVRNIVAKGGVPGRGKLIVKARNDARHGQESLPVGIAAALQSTRSVTVQAVTSDGACFGATLTDVHADGATSFRAK